MWLKETFGELGAGRMEKSGNQEHRCCRNRSLEICGHVLNVDNWTSVNHSGDVAADTREQTVAVLISLYLTNRRIRQSCHCEERHQNERSHSQVTMLSPAT